MVTKFKRDNHLRANLFHPDSFKHQGKANLNLLFTLLQGVPGGEIVLDPMAGTGSLWIGTDLGYPVICGELEPHWAALCETNRKSIGIRRLFAASTSGLTSQWDATRLPLASGSVGGIITSPPYWDMLSDWHITSKGLQAPGHDDYGPAYGVTPANIGNVHIYEDYLRVMFKVYTEARRVLRPLGIMALILKDRVHKGKRVTISEDAITLCEALGFKLVSVTDRAVTPSLHRHVLSQHCPDAPRIDTEQALVFQKVNDPPRQTKTALILGPKANSRPGWILFKKQFAYVDSQKIVAGIMTKEGLIPAFGLRACFEMQAPGLSGFRAKKEYARCVVADLVTKHGLVAGSEIELHCPWDIGQYLAERLETLGMTVSDPTHGLNLGQKLKWYTEALS
jgi:hypothetical protein